MYEYSVVRTDVHVIGIEMLVEARGENIHVR